MVCFGVWRRTFADCSIVSGYAFNVLEFVPQSAQKNVFESAGRSRIEPTLTSHFKCSHCSAGSRRSPVACLKVPSIAKMEDLGRSIVGSLRYDF